MNFRLRFPCPIRFSLAMLLLVYVGACRPPASISEPTAGRVAASAPFAEGEIWILSSDTTTGQSGLAYLTMSGAGDLVSSIEVVTNVFTNDVCLIRTPDSAFGDFLPDTPSPYSIDFEFDGASMRVNASSQGDESSNGCSVEFRATVARRGTEQVLFGFNAFDVSIQGQALVSGEPVRFAPLQLNRLRTPKPIACQDSPTSLVGLSWTVGNVNPATFIPLPPSTEATVTVSGSEETISSVNWVGGSFTGCSGTGGTFTFDGTNLSFESSFPAFELFPPDDPDCNDACEFAYNGVCDDGRGNELPVTIRCQPGTDCSDCGRLTTLPSPLEPPPLEPPPTCSINFSGKVAECGVFLPPIVGLGPASEVLRIEGVGSYAEGEDSGELATVYLTIHRGGAGPCGVAMIPTMAMIFFGLCGFRFISRRLPCRGWK